MTDDDYDALSQKQLASIKRDMRISLEDAAVRATYKVMAELAQPEQPKVRTGDCLLVGVCASEGHKIQVKQEPWRESASDYERGFIDGMQKQMQSSVDKAVNRMAQPEQEPVAFVHGDDLDNLLDDRRVAFIQRTKSGHRKTALYTIPLQCKPLTEWRPIETAPKGDVLLYCNKHIPIYVGRQRYGNLGEPSQDKFAWRCSGSGRYANPTHWMPLPETPIKAAHGIKE